MQNASVTWVQDRQTRLRLFVALAAESAFPSRRDGMFSTQQDQTAYRAETCAEAHRAAAVARVVRRPSARGTRQRPSSGSSCSRSEWFAAAKLAERITRRRRTRPPTETREPSDRPPLRPGKIRVSILQDHHRAIPAWFAACRRNRRAPSPSDREPGPDGVARATLACGVESLSQQIRTCNFQSTKQIKGTSDERENCFLDR